MKKRNKQWIDRLDDAAGVKANNEMAEKARARD